MRFLVLNAAELLAADTPRKTAGCSGRRPTWRKFGAALTAQFTLQAGRREGRTKPPRKSSAASNTHSPAQPAAAGLRMPAGGLASSQREVHLHLRLNLDRLSVEQVRLVLPLLYGFDRRGS